MKAYISMKKITAKVTEFILFIFADASTYNTAATVNAKIN